MSPWFQHWTPPLSQAEVTMDGNLGMLLGLWCPGKSLISESLHLEKPHSAYIPTLGLPGALSNQQMVPTLRGPQN